MLNVAVPRFVGGFHENRYDFPQPGVHAACCCCLLPTSEKIWRSSFYTFACPNLVPEQLCSRVRSGDSPHICIALYENGLYRLSKVGADKSDLLPSPILQGTLTKEELDRFVALLHNLRSNYRQDGIVREGTASFVAELTSNGKPVRYIWTDADHRDPFPGSIRKVVHWMQDFKAEDSTVITLHELSSIPSPCPSLNEKSFQPVIAGLNPDQTGGSCRAKR